MSEATFVFADIAGFTALSEAHGDQESADLIDAFCRAVRVELPAYEGTHVKTIRSRASATRRSAGTPCAT